MQHLEMVKMIDGIFIYVGKERSDCGLDWSEL